VPDVALSEQFRDKDEEVTVSPSRAVLFAPIVMCGGFFLATVILAAIGPISWPFDNPSLLYGFLLACAGALRRLDSWVLVGCEAARFGRNNHPESRLRKRGSGRRVSGLPGSLYSHRAHGDRKVVSRHLDRSDQPGRRL
jgi:hypothetical protein